MTCARLLPLVAVLLAPLPCRAGGDAKPIMSGGAFAEAMAAAYAPTAEVPAAARFNQRVVEGARALLEREVRYEPAYVALSYPGGDVPEDTGVCADVAVRAFRHAGVDLQVLTYREQQRPAGAAAWPRFANLWGHTRPDKNIDHRRVPNLWVVFHRRAAALSLDASVGRWMPGDVVIWQIAGGQLHVGIVDSTRAPSGRWQVIHHWPGQSVASEDALTRWRITGHYRWKAR